MAPIGLAAACLTPTAPWRGPLRLGLHYGRQLLPAGPADFGHFFKKTGFPEPILAGLWTMELGNPGPREAAPPPQLSWPWPVCPQQPYGAASFVHWA